MRQCFLGSCVLDTSVLMVPFAQVSRAVGQHLLNHRAFSKLSSASRRARYFISAAPGEMWAMLSTWLAGLQRARGVNTQHSALHSARRGDPRATGPMTIPRNAVFLAILVASGHGHVFHPRQWCLNSAEFKNHHGNFLKTQISVSPKTH